MIAWVESQSVGGIAVIVFGFCYLMAALILAAVVAAATRPAIAAALRLTSPTMLTPLSLIAGLLIAFLAARVWSNVDHAHGLFSQEVRAVHEAIRLGNALPGDTGDALRAALRAYLDFVVAEDFPAMAAHQASPREPPTLAGLTGALLLFTPATPGQALAQNRVMAALEQIVDARRSRILLSRAAIAPIQWLVVTMLAALILTVIAMVHLDRRETAAINMLLFSTAFAACLVLLMANDGPFATGGFTVQPSGLRELGADLRP